MAAYDFPSSPSNGDTVTVNTVLYTFNSNKSRWETSLDSPGIDDLATSTVVTLSSSGNAGIGTATPAAKLTISDTTDTPVRIVSTTGDGSYFRLDDPDSHIFFGTSGSAGDIEFWGGGTSSTNATLKARLLASGGIVFGTSTSTSEALDDYEIGSWTPTVSQGWPNSVSYSQQFGKYTKVGNLVTCWWYLRFTGSDTSGSFGVGVTIAGLPFTCANSEASRGGSIAYWDCPITQTATPVPYITKNGSTVSFYAGSPASLVTSNANSTDKYIIGHVIYPTT